MRGAEAYRTNRGRRAPPQKQLTLISGSSGISTTGNALKSEGAVWLPKLLLATPFEDKSTADDYKCVIMI